MTLLRRSCTLLLAALLGACTSMRIVDSEVRSFGAATLVAAPATYQLQRLPSQQDAAFEPVVQAVSRAMAARGLHSVDQSPQSLLTVSWSQREWPRAPWESESTPFFGHFWMGTAGSGGGVGMRFPALDVPWYERRLGLVLRDTNTGEVVFETQAQHDGRWRDTEAVLPAMLEAALHNYPGGHPQTQTISIEIPR